MSSITGDSVQTYRLYPAAEIGVKELGLPQAEEETIASCISRYSYSTVSNACDYFNWLIFRISNAFAGMIGMPNTWDNAVKVLNDHMLQRVNDEGDIITSNPQSAGDWAVNRYALGAVSVLSSTFLDDLYLLQTVCSDDSSKTRENFNLSNLMKKMHSDVEVIRKRNQELPPS